MNGHATVYRVQDIDGRGPYKPGFSHRWIDPDNKGQNCPDVFTEFPGLWPLPPRPGYAYGCAFTNLDALHKWFSPSELSRLFAFGYNVVSMDVDEVLAKSEAQCVFARRGSLARGVVIIPDHALII